MSAFEQVEIVEAPFDPEAVHAAFRRGLTQAGAVAAFTGIVRPSADDEAVDALELTHYPGFTEKRIDALCDEAAARWPLEAVRVVHRVGVMRPGDAIVFVATASAHRRAAFEAADFLMDYLKSDAPFWKREHRGGRAHWIEPRAEDYADKARWARETS